MFMSPAVVTIWSRPAKCVEYTLLCQCISLYHYYYWKKYIR